MERITLEQAAHATGGTAYGMAEINSISIDTRKVQPGDLFICIRGERFDGHAFAQQAADNGAIALMTDHLLDVSLPQVVVENTGKAMLELAHWYRRQFTLPVVGLTGSVGKTTTKEFVALVVSAKYKTLKTEGNLNNEIGVPQMLYRLDDSTQAAVIEMGMNHAGEIHRLSQAVAPTIGLITNIGVSHIENLGSREGILNAKLEILDGMQPGSPLVLNIDNDLLKTVKRQDYPLITFAVEDKSADFVAKDIVESDGKTTFTVQNAEFVQQVTIPTVGIHNVYNALAAFAVGALCQVDAKAAAAALADYVPAGMRQRNRMVGDVHVIEDCYNASPDSMQAALTTLRNVKSGKKIAVLADMLELGDYSKTAHEAVGRMAAENGIDDLLAYGSEAAAYVSAAQENGLQNAVHFDTKEELAERLYQIAEKGDTVLFKGSRGMKLEEVMNLIYKRWERE